MIETKKIEDDNTKDEKRIFLLSIAEKFYESHLKKVQNSVTVASLLITANGIILIAVFNLFSILTKNGEFHPSSLLVLGFYVIILPIFGSILYCLIYIHDVNPISFDLSPLSEKLKTGTYNELLETTYDVINDLSQDNRKNYQRLQKNLDFAMLMFMSSFILLIILFGVVLFQF